MSNRTDEFDLKVMGVLSALAAVVNRAGRSEPTSAGAMRVSKVPTGLLYEAKQVLEWFEGSEFDTDAIRQATRRILD